MKSILLVLGVDVLLGYLAMPVVEYYKSIGIVAESVRYTIVDATGSFLLIEAVAYLIYLIIKSIKKAKK